ncbi:MAG: hypothetical protein A3G25_12270 [Betaproteobacteria bacterium RIFCSPLOWO2_12_FULL_63_13]|nr:MAG: hypothetical protein A3G25_12270 [Betaproteobacteria bacterium RIFCSPLOWO2_12_FULL_63_13]
MLTPSRALFFVAAALSGVMLLVPGIAGIDPLKARTAAVVVLAIGFWSTAVVPPFLGSLVFLFAAMVLGVAPASVVFSGFHSGAMWLVFGGLVLGLAVQRVGLDVRLVRNLLYGEYFGLNFVVLGVGALVVYPLLICLLFRDTPRLQREQDATRAWSGAERRLLVILLVALALWVTDTLHGVSPAWVALGAALLCVSPGIGLLPPAAVTRDIDYSPVLFLAGIIGLGAIATHKPTYIDFPRSLSHLRVWPMREYRATLIGAPC